MNGKIYILTGAGISAESGMDTYRDTGGLWQSQDLLAVASHEAFQNSPGTVWKFIARLKSAASAAQPNAAHRALALTMLEARTCGLDVVLVTQNVDSLHERALAEVGLPAAECIAMHGKLSISSCTACGRSYNDRFVYFDECGVATDRAAENLHIDVNVPVLSERRIRESDGLPVSPCCQALFKPGVVFFGEEPLQLNRCYAEVLGTTVFLAVGTSCRVSPACDFVRWVVRLNPSARTIFVNPRRSDASEHFKEFFVGPASFELPRLLQSLVCRDDCG